MVGCRFAFCAFFIVVCKNDFISSGDLGNVLIIPFRSVKSDDTLNVDDILSTILVNHVQN